VWAKDTKWKSDTNEDDGLVVVRYASGAWSTLAMSSIESRPGQFFKITGTKGTCLLDWKQCEVITHKDSQTNSVITPIRKNEGWKLYQNVADHLTKGAKLIISPEWARRPIHILDLACRSSKSGHALKAKYQ
jgi:predicted dehydrogenase